MTVAAMSFRTYVIEIFRSGTVAIAPAARAPAGQGPKSVFARDDEAETSLHSQTAAAILIRKGVEEYESRRVGAPSSEVTELRSLVKRLEGELAAADKKAADAISKLRKLTDALKGVEL